MTKDKSGGKSVIYNISNTFNVGRFIGLQSLCIYIFGYQLIDQKLSFICRIKIILIKYVTLVLATIAITALFVCKI